MIDDLLESEEYKSLKIPIGKKRKYQDTTTTTTSVVTLADEEKLPMDHTLAVALLQQYAYLIHVELLLDGDNRLAEKLQDRVGASTLDPTWAERTRFQIETFLTSVAISIPRLKTLYWWWFHMSWKLKQLAIMAQKLQDPLSLSSLPPLYLALLGSQFRFLDSVPLPTRKKGEDTIEEECTQRYMDLVQQDVREQGLCFTLYQKQKEK